MTEIEGLAELERNFNKVLDKIGDINKDALNDIALDLLGKAKDLAPVDTGDLKGSGSVEIDDYTASVGFEEPYAVKQHEHTEYKHPRGGQAKYLEQPFKQNISKYIKHMADANKRSLK